MIDDHRLRAAIEAAVEAITAALPASDGPVRMVAPGELLVDPHRFQFRVSTINATGTDGRLKDCARWNPALANCLLAWPDPSGPLCLVDGHHRHRLALANGVPAVAVLLIEAKDAIEARCVGALSNVAAGTATAPDLAKLLRDTGMSAAEVCHLGVSPRSRLLKDASALVALDPGLFARVATGEVPVEVGLALAAAGSPAVQRDLAREAERQRWNPEQVAEAAGIAHLATVQRSDPSGCLPGMAELMATENSNIGAILSIRAAIRKALAAEQRAYKTAASKRAAATLESANIAVIDHSEAITARDANRSTLRLFNQLINLSGPLQSVIRTIAADVNTGITIPTAVANRMTEVRQAMDSVSFYSLQSDP